jgi:hypothetical protein
VATVVEESAAPPPPAAIVIIKEERTVTETIVPQVTLEPPVETDIAGEDMVMVPADGGSAPLPPEGEHDTATSMAPEFSTAAGVASIEGTTDLSSSRYMDFPGIGTIDLDAVELPSNDWEILVVATEQMFADPSTLDAITSVTSALRQDEGAGGSVPSVASEAAERVLGESAAGTESVVIVSPPTPVGEGMGASQTQPTEAVTVVPATLVVGTVEGVVGGAGPSSPRPVVAAVEEVLMPSQPAVAPQERDAPEGATRAASPEIQEAEENSGMALSQGVGSGEAQVLELACAPWAAAYEAGDDTEDDEEAAACNTLKRGLAWACHEFDELILPTTSVSFLA